MDIATVLGQCRLFAGIPDQPLAWLVASSQLQRYHRNENVFHVGDPAREIYVVGQGFLKAYSLRTNGEEHVHAVHGPGGVIGEVGAFASPGTRRLAVSALSEALVARVPRQALIAAFPAAPLLAERLLAKVADTAHQQTQALSHLTSMDIRDRLLARLREVAATCSVPDPDGSRIMVALTHADLAAMTAASRPNVSRAVHALEQEGRLIRRGRRYVLPEAPNG